MTRCGAVFTLVVVALVNAARGLNVGHSANEISTQQLRDLSLQLTPHECDVISRECPATTTSTVAVVTSSTGWRKFDDFGLRPVFDCATELRSWIEKCDVTSVGEFTRNNLITPPLQRAFVVRH